MAYRGQLRAGNVQRSCGSFDFSEADKVFAFAHTPMKVWGTACCQAEASHLLACGLPTGYKCGDSAAWSFGGRG
jgi:hypothetical protein